MAKCTTSVGINLVTGALRKKREQGVTRLSVTRVKHFHDPLTGEVVSLGPNELYLQERRDLNKHPLSANEKRARSNWGVTCREAPTIIRDKSHPRYMELYNRWRAQLSSPAPILQFPNFVRHVLSQEG